VPLSPEDLRGRLCALGAHLRSLIANARGVDKAAVTGSTAADVIYGIDRVADDALLGWFEQHWQHVRVVSEGLDEPVEVGGEPEWTVIVDTIDGTRGLMYDKRSAWCLAAAAPCGGSLADLRAAAMTELPTSKMGMADQLSGYRGGGLHAERVSLREGSTTPLLVRPSSATDLEHSFSGVAKFFLPGKTRLATLEAELFQRLGCVHVFDDEYLSSGGQLYELMTGHDRFVADLRPLVDGIPFACHPYDVCTSLLLEEAGGVVTDPWGHRLDVPLDTVSPVAWVGYANAALAEWIGPVLRELVDEFGTR
jgi:fructose-1,6-bisphosphatase/inositol monophosphatase family enzyme